jgi:uncharacterized protein (DUF2237 family)
VVLCGILEAGNPLATPKDIKSKNPQHCNWKWNKTETKWKDLGNQETNPVIIAKKTHKRTRDIYDI